jgi:hypothetical protein
MDNVRATLFTIDAHVVQAVVLLVFITSTTPLSIAAAKHKQAGQQ